MFPNYRPLLSPRKPLVPLSRDCTDTIQLHPPVANEDRVANDEVRWALTPRRTAGWDHLSYSILHPCNPYVWRRSCIPVQSTLRDNPRPMAYWPRGHFVGTSGGVAD